MFTSNSKSFYFKICSLVLAGFAVLFMFSNLTLNTFYKASILSYPQHEPFDGLVYPVQEVPNWVKLSQEKWNASYSVLSFSDLVTLPKYNPSELKTSTDDLKWGNSTHDKIRNAKITYSVPYMGNYLLDGQEYAGSHLAVDIKIPEGTPIYAIGNGTVTKASTQNGGFGHHIVLIHNNFPTLENEQNRNTIYSSYSHLSELNVSVGDVVRKGEQIGLSGRTGTATTPHLHFQIDNSDSPWQPFWPFTWQEAYEEGLDFFGAVNAGLGKERALEFTIHPMNYVQKYLDSDLEYSKPSSEPSSQKATSNIPGNNVVDDRTTTPTSSQGHTASSNVTTSEKPSSTDSEETLVGEELIIEVDVKSSYFQGSSNNFTISLKDEYDNVYSGPLEYAITIRPVNNNVDLENRILSVFNFDNQRTAKINFLVSNIGNEKIRVTYGNQTFDSDFFEIKVNPASYIDNKISSSNEDSKSIELDKTDLIFTDIPKNHKHYKATKYLYGIDVIEGYQDGSYKPNQVVSRTEALKFILEANKSNLITRDLPFTDINEDDWYIPYLSTAYDMNIVEGYEDGTFKPNSVVNKAEFFKMLFEAKSTNIPESLSTRPFYDVSLNDWFAPYFAHAKDLGIIDSKVLMINPELNMTRGEVADVIYRFMSL